MLGAKLPKQTQNHVKLVQNILRACTLELADQSTQDHPPISQSVAVEHVLFLEDFLKQWLDQGEISCHASNTSPSPTLKLRGK